MKESFGDRVVNIPFKRYIMVDTWNGSGYSSENGTDMKIFSDKAVAHKHAKRIAKSQSNDIEIFENSIYSFQIEEDDGSYQIHELKEGAYAVLIECNTNEVTLLTRKEYEDEVKDIEEHTSLEEDFKRPEENGDVFYGGFDDYDYQFRLIKNI